MLVSTILVVAAAIQVTDLLVRMVYPYAQSVWAVRDRGSLARSAALYLGPGDADYIQFVRQNVPQDGRILLPPKEIERSRFAVAKSMRYFFFPRQVLECQGPTDPTCLRYVDSPGVYTLAINRFPDDDLARIDSRLMDFPAGGEKFRGLVLPREVDPGTQALETASSTTTGLSILVTDLVVLAALWLLGVVLSRAILGPGGLVDAGILGLPLGAGLLTWALFLASLIGLPLTLGVLSAVYACFLIGTCGLFLVRRSREEPGTPLAEVSRARIRWPWKLATWVVLGLVVGLWLLAIGLSVGEAYTLHDPAQIWGIKGYGIALEGNVLAGEWWGVHGLAYPLNVPLFATIYYLVDGDILPGSKLIFPLLGVVMIAGGARFLSRHGVNPGMTAVGALLVTSIPAFYYQLTRGMANVPFTAYLVLGLLWSIEGILEDRKGGALIGGLLWGLACWTRAEGALFVSALAALLILLAGPRRIGARRIALWLGPAVTVAGAWFLFSLSYVLDSHLWSALTTYSREGAFEGPHKYYAYLMAKAVVLDSFFIGEHRTIWGTSVVAVVLTLVFSLSRFVRDRSRIELAVVLGGALCGALTLSMFYIRSYSKPDFFDFVQRSMPRALFPAAVLLVLSAFLVLARRPEQAGPTSD